MKIKRIRDLVASGSIKVHNPQIGFTVRDLCEGYTNNDDGCTTDSVFGYDRKLNIRPSYQRNSVYGADKRDAVIETILEGCPLNVMYWIDNEDGTYEVLDGQQRTLAICNYVFGKFSIESPVFPAGAPHQDFFNLQANLPDIASKILDYELDIYICRGKASDKMNWFKRINTSGEPLNEQELLNASHTGKWLSDAKAYFSASAGRGVSLADKNPATSAPEPLLNGSWNRQDYLRTAIQWAALGEGLSGSSSIEQYMNTHGNKDADASLLWQYFSKVLEWVRSKFITYNKALKGLDWGAIYEAYQAGKLSGNIIMKSGAEIQDEIIKLTMDDEITAGMKGIYLYIIYGDGKYLQIRQFDEKTARAAYEKQRHHCPYCVSDRNNREYAFKEMHADHIMPWSKGGKTVESNCQMLCKHHNESKGNRW